MSNVSKGGVSGNSIGIGKFVFWILISVSLGVGFLYYIRYTTAFYTNDIAEMDEFWAFSQVFMVYFSISILVFMFLLGLWVYGLYVDMFNHFSRFDQKPMNAMLWVILPVINLYGIGIVFARIINFIDDYHEEYRKENKVLQYSLIVFYASFVALFLSWILGITIPTNPDLYFIKSALVIAGMQVVALTCAIVGLSLVIRFGIKIMQKRLMVLETE